MNSKKSKKNQKVEGSKKERMKGGRQILVVGLVALVLAAGYYRWTLGTVDEAAVSVSGTARPDETPQPENDAETFGFKDKDDKDEKDDKEEKENTDNQSGNDEEEETKQSGGISVITESRRERDKLRGETMDKWKEISSNSEASDSAKKEAEDNILKLTEYSESENVIETNVKSKGFDDCFAQISDSGVSVVVKGGKLDSATVAQIKDIIITETGEAASRIKISAE